MIAMSLFSLLAFLFISATDDLKFIQLPPGFSISLVTDKVPDARTLALGKNGTVFVGTSREKVFALLPSGEVLTLYSNLAAPNGVLVIGDDLYIGEIPRISRAKKIETALKSPPKLESVFAKLPSNPWHGFRVLREGPDHQIYFGIGAPCNVCENANPFGTVAKLTKDFQSLEIIARGVRNSVGFDWDPLTHDLWFTDNGRDLLGDDLPPDELNHVRKVGENFGFPWCHGGDLPDPDMNKSESKHKCLEFSPPAQKLGAHVASLGMIFYTGKQFPEAYRNQIFIAEHGSWNRSKKNGYRISLVRLDKKSRKVLSYEPFAQGWLSDNEEVRGRPVAFLQMPDGSMLVSDDFSGKIYRITYR
jgi:glucose/arabinose dehydrogenase